MNRNPLTYVNTVLIVLCVGAGIFAYTRGIKGTTVQLPGPGESEAEAREDGAERGPEKALIDESRLAALEERVSRLELADGGKQAGSGVEDPGDAPSPTGSAEAAGTDPSGPGGLSPEAKKAVEKLVDEGISKKVAEWQKQWSSAYKKPRKKTIEEVGRILELRPDQTSRIRDLYRGLEREGMKILFGLEEDKELDALKSQLRQAEFDPELKESLREKIYLNWTLYQNRITALYVKADSSLRKIMDRKKLADFYKYKVELDDPEFPDVEKMFFGGEGGGKED
jgi:hypothetical protein